MTKDIEEARRAAIAADYAAKAAGARYRVEPTEDNQRAYEGAFVASRLAWLRYAELHKEQVTCQ